MENNKIENFLKAYKNNVSEHGLKVMSDDIVLDLQKAKEYLDTKRKELVEEEHATIPQRVEQVLIGNLLKGPGKTYNDYLESYKIKNLNKIWEKMDFNLKYPLIKAVDNVSNSYDLFKNKRAKNSTALENLKENKVLDYLAAVENKASKKELQNRCGEIIKDLEKHTELFIEASKELKTFPGTQTEIIKKYLDQVSKIESTEPSKTHSDLCRSFSLQDQSAIWDKTPLNYKNGITDAIIKFKGNVILTEVLGERHKAFKKEKENLLLNKKEKKREIPKLTNSLPEGLSKKTTENKLER
jgi:hypothetical protein